MLCSSTAYTLEANVQPARGMKYFCVLWLIASPALGVEGGATVESISLTGAQNYRLSQGLVEQIQRLIGEKFNQPALDDLARGIGNELGGYSVSQKVTPGDQPEQIGRASCRERV